MTRPRSDLTSAELALAYELKQEGCCWKRIATGLNCDDVALRSAIAQAKQAGIAQRGRPTVHSERLVQTAIMVKYSTRLSWRSIAEHMYIDGEQLRQSCYRYMRGMIDEAVSR